jgi:hypothetical protein
MERDGLKASTSSCTWFFQIFICTVIYLGNWDCSVSIVTRLNDQGVKIRVPERARNFSHFHNIQTSSGESPSILYNGYQSIFPRGSSNRSMKLSTHLHLLLRLRTAEICLHYLIRFHCIMLNELYLW